MIKKAKYEIGGGIKAFCAELESVEVVQTKLELQPWWLMNDSQ